MCRPSAISRILLTHNAVFRAASSQAIAANSNRCERNHPHAPLVRVAGTRTANGMVRKLMMSARQFNPRHVAGRAILGVLRAARFRLRLACRMTRLALRIVIGVVMTHFLMRIVARQATDAAVL